MKTNTWYSTERLDLDSTAIVHHNNLVCKSGANIGKNFRRYGTDNRPLCKNCSKLNESGK